MNKYKRECINCNHCKELFCNEYELEIIVGRMNISDNCAEFTPKEAQP